MSGDNSYARSFVTPDAAVEMTALLPMPNRQYKFLQGKKVSKANIQDKIKPTNMASSLLGKFGKDLLSQVKLPEGDLEEVATGMSPQSIQIDEDLILDNDKSYTGHCYEFLKLNSTGSDTYHKISPLGRYDSRALFAKAESLIKPIRVGGFTEFITNLELC